MTVTDRTATDPTPPTKSAATTQVFRVYIQATQQQVWDAITQPEWNARYGYPGHSEYDLRPGGAYRGIADANLLAMGLPELLVDGEVLEADPMVEGGGGWAMILSGLKTLLETGKDLGIHDA